MRKYIFGPLFLIILIIVAYFVLSGKGLFGLGKGSDSGSGAGAGEQEAAVTADATSEADKYETIGSMSRQETESNSIVTERSTSIIDIRIQGREYNYQNITYGNEKHTLEDLLRELDAFPRDTRINLTVEDDATKNAVDDLEKSLINAGFVDIHK